MLLKLNLEHLQALRSSFVIDKSVGDKGWRTIDNKPLRRNVGSINDLVNEQKKVYPFLLSIWKQRGESAYVNFASQLESYHDFVHVWVGGISFY